MAPPLTLTHAKVKLLLSEEEKLQLHTLCPHYSQNQEPVSQIGGRGPSGNSSVMGTPHLVSGPVRPCRFIKNHLFQWTPEALTVYHTALSWSVPESPLGSHHAPQVAVEFTCPTPTEALWPKTSPHVSQTPKLPPWLGNHTSADPHELKNDIWAKLWVAFHTKVRAKFYSVRSAEMQLRPPTSGWQ